MPARTSDKPSKSVYATFILYRNFPAKTRHQIRASCSKNERTTQKLAFHWSNNHAMASRAHAATEKLYYYSTRHAKDWDEQSGQEDGSSANSSLRFLVRTKHAAWKMSALSCWQAKDQVDRRSEKTLAPTHQKPFLTFCWCSVCVYSHYECKASLNNINPIGSYSVINSNHIP